MNFNRLEWWWHAWVVASSLQDFDAQGEVELPSFTLRIQSRGRSYRLYPRFMARDGDRLAFINHAVRDGRFFLGWLPYLNKRWPLGYSKLAFKSYCADKGLPTPRMWREPQAGMRGFLVKLDQSSFSQGIKGPFRDFDAADPGQALPQGGYYEQFVPGRMVKAWYWEDRLASLEMFDMPAARGDGKNSLRTLIGQMARAPRTPNWTNVEEILRYQGLGLDAVLPQGATAIADFRYGSNLTQGEHSDAPYRERYRGSSAPDKLAALGPALWAGIPEELRPATLYAVDAIVDADEQVWLLEMNCNPAMHPEAYPLMFERLFGARRSAQQSAGREPMPIPPSALPQPASLPNPTTIISPLMGLRLPS
jgi:hypothetical protein